MIVNVVLFQNASSVVIEVNTHLLPTVYPVASESGLAAGSDPDAGQSIRVDLITLNNATPIVMLEENDNCKPHD